MVSPSLGPVDSADLSMTLTNSDQKPTLHSDQQAEMPLKAAPGLNSKPCPQVTWDNRKKNKAFSMVLEMPFLWVGNARMTDKNDNYQYKKELTQKYWRHLIFKMLL